MILVDKVTEYDTRLRYKKFSHMVSTTGEEELHSFADQLSLKREWWQSSSFSHYDITPPTRALAIKQGAFAVSSRACLFLNYDYANQRKVRPCKICEISVEQDRSLATFGYGGFFVDSSKYCNLTPYLAEVIATSSRR